MTINLKDFLDEQFIPELISFIRTNHGDSHVMTNRVMIDYFFWDKEKKSYNLIVAFAQSKIVGILGYIPTTFKWGTNGNDELEAVWTSHWTVDINYRYGIGILLMKRLQELYPIVAGQGANNINKKIVTKMGHHFLDHITRTVKVYNSPFLTQTFPNLDLSELLTVKEIPTDLYAKLDSKLTSLRFKPTKFNYQPDWKFYRNYYNGTKKDFNYIQSKYINHPVFKYHFLLSGEKTQPCLIIFRLEKTSGRAEFQCVRIVDVIFPDLEKSILLLKSLFEKLDIFALENKVVFADFFCTNTNIQKQIENFGFIRETKHNLPNLLNPIVDKSRDQNLELCFSNKNVPQWEKTYFTKSDGDQDRPNSNNLIEMTSKTDEISSFK